MNKGNSHTEFNSRPLEYWRGLIGRYFEAETTGAEEQQLRLFLTTEDAANKEFDEIKAVMGFLVTGKALYHSQKKKYFPLPAVRWVAAAVIFLMAGAVTWRIVDHRQNICVAYIYGEKCTDTREVMSQLQLSLCQVQHEEEEITVESQLNDIFRTLDDENVTTISNK